MNSCFLLHCIFNFNVPVFQEFSLKELVKLRVGERAYDVEETASLVAASKYGLLFIGTPTTVRIIIALTRSIHRERQSNVANVEFHLMKSKMYFITPKNCVLCIATPLHITFLFAGLNIN